MGLKAKPLREGAPLAWLDAACQPRNRACPQAVRSVPPSRDGEGAPPRAAPLEAGAVAGRRPRHGSHSRSGQCPPTCAPGRFAVLDIHSDWVGPCVVMQPMYESLTLALESWESRLRILTVSLALLAAPPRALQPQARAACQTLRVRPVTSPSLACLAEAARRSTRRCSPTRTRSASAWRSPASPTLS